jgi:hypothetical protein
MLRLASSWNHEEHEGHEEPVKFRFVFFVSFVVQGLP